MNRALLRVADPRSGARLCEARKVAMRVRHWTSGLNTHASTGARPWFLLAQTPLTCYEILMRHRWQKFAALFSLGLIYLSPVRADTWDALVQSVRRKFPTVRQLSTQALADWLAATNRPAPLLADARAPEEFAVSHLRDAQRLDTVDKVKAVVRSPAQPIVVYCSVGYRSSSLAEKLQAAGFTNVWNLEGSIFAWANEGRPVFRGPTNLQPAQVHPYSAKWGQLLDKRLHPAPKP